jgi:hypothetical protein
MAKGMALSRAGSNVLASFVAKAAIAIHFIA